MSYQSPIAIAEHPLVCRVETVEDAHRALASNRAWLEGARHLGFQPGLSGSEEDVDARAHLKAYALAESLAQQWWKLRQQWAEHPRHKNALDVVTCQVKGLLEGPVELTNVGLVARSGTDRDRRAVTDAFSEAVNASAVDLFSQMQHLAGMAPESQIKLSFASVEDLKRGLLEPVLQDQLLLRQAETVALLLWEDRQQWAHHPELGLPWALGVTSMRLQYFFDYSDGQSGGASVTMSNFSFAEGLTKEEQQRAEQAFRQLVFKRWEEGGKGSSLYGVLMRVVANHTDNQLSMSLDSLEGLRSSLMGAARAAAWRAEGLDRQWTEAAPTKARRSRL